MCRARAQVVPLGCALLLACGAKTGLDVAPTIDTPGSIVGLALGASHSCAVHRDGTATCVGANAYGQLGDGTYTQRLRPVAVADLAGVAQLAAGSEHTCALLVDRTVRCWGRNSDGRLGDGTQIDRLAPTAVVGLTSAIQAFGRSTIGCAAGGMPTEVSWETAAPPTNRRRRSSIGRVIVHS